jgi:hypothetical protein
MQALVLSFPPFRLNVADERVWKDGHHGKDDPGTRFYRLRAAIRTCSRNQA